MSKIEKALSRLCSNPRPKDFTWDELVLVMTNYGFDLHAGSGGSGRKFIHVESGYPLQLHEPHPTSILKPYAIKAAIKALKDTGEYEDERSA